MLIAWAAACVGFVIGGLFGRMLEQRATAERQHALEKIARSLILSCAPKEHGPVRVRVGKAADGSPVLIANDPCPCTAGLQILTVIGLAHFYDEERTNDVTSVEAT